MPLNRTDAPVTQFVNLDILPTVISQTMANGIPLHLIPVPETSVVRVDFMFTGGVWVQDMPLQAMLAMRLVKEGTTTRSVKEINELLDFYGASFSAVVYKSYSLVSVVCLSKFLPQALSIVQDILSNPVFDSDSCQLAIQQAYANYMIKQDRVKHQAEKLFYETLLGERHPMNDYEGQEHFQMLSQAVFRDYYNKCVSSANCRIFITGGYDDEAVSVVARTFGSGQWGSGGASVVMSNVEPFQSPLQRLEQAVLPHGVSFSKEQRRVSFSMPQPTVQSALYAGCALPRLEGEDHTLMKLANMLLGGFFGSRLMSNIREEKGYTYGISSALAANPFFTLFCIQTETANQFVDKVISEAKAEIERIVSELPGQDELEIVKKYYSGNLCRIFEPSFTYTNYLIKQIGVGRLKDDTLEAMRRMKEATPQDIQNVMSRYISPNNVVWCVAGA